MLAHLTSLPGLSLPILAVAGHIQVFLQDLSTVMIVAGIVTILFRQLKLPVVLGYILAGLIIGPHTPPYTLIEDRKTIESLSELGVILLMFSLGLEFSLRKLGDVGATAVIGATAEILLMAFLGYEIGLLFGWSKVNAIFLGAILAMSSTTIIIKALNELGLTKERFAGLIFGILIVEDILGIVILALISGFAATGSLAPKEIGITVVQLSAFLGVVLVAGLILVPRLLDYVARFKSNEMLLLTVIGLCFGISLLALKMGYSVALGAFLIGAVIAEARQIAKIEMLMNPVRDLFSAVFFVSIGLLIDPNEMLKYWAPILVITGAVVFGKIIACSVGSFVAGNDIRTSLRVGMSLAQIGEFSFIIAGLGLHFKVVDPFIYPIAVAVSAITTLLTPFLIKASDPLADWIDKHAPVSFHRMTDAYSRWLGAVSEKRRGNIGMNLLRKWGLQIGLNLLLITAVFIAAAAMRKHAIAFWPEAPIGENGIKAILWLGAMILSLPMFIAVFRKLQAAGMLVSEMSVTRAAAGQNTAPLRGLISTTVVAGGCAALVLLTLLLSSTILPSRNMLIVLGLALVVAVILLRRAFVRVYAKAQIALIETFEQTPEHHHAHEEEPVVPLPQMLREAQLLTVAIESASWVVGKMIADLKLRTKTGVSIVGIERRGNNIINPGPEEELLDGDRVLLLGTGEQLKATEELLQATAAV